MSIKIIKMDNVELIKYLRLFKVITNVERIGRHWNSKRFIICSWMLSFWSFLYWCSRLPILWSREPFGKGSAERSLSKITRVSFWILRISAIDLCATFKEKRRFTTASRAKLIINSSRSNNPKVFQKKFTV